MLITLSRQHRFICKNRILYSLCAWFLCFWVYYKDFQKESQWEERRNKSYIKNGCQEIARQPLWLLFRIICFPKNRPFHLGKCGEDDHSEDSAGDDFAGTNGQHHKRDWKVHTVSVVKNERYDNRISYDRRQWSKPFAGTAQFVSKDCTDQCCDTSEDDIYRDCTAKQVGEDTSYK